MLETLRFETEVPTEIIAGVGALASVWERLAALEATRPLVVCGSSVRGAGLVDRLLESKPDAVQVAVFDEVEPDPSDATVARGGQAAREADADGVIAIGGGSSMDAAKAIAVEALGPGWVACHGKPGTATDVQQALPLIAIPTTAGTASEVTPFSVITYRQSARKLALNHPALYPRVAILDPTLLASAPQEARMAAGLDALTHAVESYVSRQATEGTRRHAAQAIQLIGGSLRDAVHSAEDTEAQSAMQRAATMAGLAFSKSRLGIVHAMALPLSALFHVPHGVANAVLLPHGMTFNLPARPEDYRTIGRLLLCRDAAPDAPAEAVAAIRDLAADCGAPSRMRDVGVEEAAIGRMADDAMQSAHIPINPRDVTRDDVVRLYLEAH